ncbi:MAG: hypothetical protein JRJ59_05725 [Deltaproteobacteria bacterium]|nr:hypothetical protein [Deltaproteobacteria bacterium]
MPYLAQQPQASGDHVFFSDRVFTFPNPRLAQLAAKKLADCNRRNSLWALVDLVARLESDQAPDLTGPHFKKG